MVRPKVGAAEGRVGGGSRGPPPGKFCKKDTKSCVLAHFWRSVHDCSVQSSRVDLRLQMHNRSTSTSLEKGQSLMRILYHAYASMDPDFFYYGFARFGRTTLFEKWYGHGRTSRSGCYAPVYDMM